MTTISCHSVPHLPFSWTARAASSSTSPLFLRWNFLDVQSELPLAQLKAITSCAITSYLGEAANLHLITTTFEAFVKSDMVSLETFPVKGLQSVSNLPWKCHAGCCALQPSEEPDSLVKMPMTERSWLLFLSCKIHSSEVSLEGILCKSEARVGSITVWKVRTTAWGLQ